MSPTAQAQDFGSEGTFAVSGERLLGLVFSSQTAEEGGAEVTVSFTNINLLASRSQASTSNYSFARIGGDYFATDGLSIGAALGYFSLSGSVEVTAGGMSDEQGLGSGNGFIVAPRIGYAYMFSESAGIWPRGGITYVSASTESDDGSSETSTNALAFTIEAPLVLTPAPHAAILLGPMLDFGLSGSTESTSSTPGFPGTTTEVDSKGTDWGVQGGVMIWF